MVVEGDSGNVGIGTASPTAKLDVVGTLAIGGTATLAEAKSLSIGTPLLPTTDNTSTGLTAEMLAGGAIGAFETVCIHTVTGEVVISDSDAIGTMPASVSLLLLLTTQRQGQFFCKDLFGTTHGTGRSAGFFMLPVRRLVQ